MIRPCALIWAGSQGKATEIARVVTASLWDPHEAIGAVPTLAAAANRYPDVIIAVSDDGALRDPVRAIRSCADGLAQAPVIILDMDAQSSAKGQPELDGPEPDGYACGDKGYATLRHMLDDWTPAPNVILDRLVDTFGRDQIAKLARSFRDYLIESIEKLATPEATRTAHRVAGLAGTLGFEALGAEWNRVSDGEGDDVAAKRLARMAIYEISRKFD